MHVDGQTLGREHAAFGIFAGAPDANGHL